MAKLARHLRSKNRRGSKNEAPPDFINLIKDAYLKAIGTNGHNYYFSYDELLTIAEIDGANVVVAQRNDNHYAMLGHTIRFAGPIAVVSITNNGKSAVRSHFERLITSPDTTDSNDPDEVEKEMPKPKKHKSTAEIADLCFEQYDAWRLAAYYADYDALVKLNEDQDIIMSQIDMASKAKAAWNRQPQKENQKEQDKTKSQEQDEAIENSASNDKESESGDTESDEEELDDGIGDFPLCAVSGENLGFTTEQDDWTACSERLARLMRTRPTLPASWEESNTSFVDVDTPIRLPLYSCPFQDCIFHTDDRDSFLKHIGGRGADSPHFATIQEHCGKHFAIAEPLDFVHNAISIIERINFPRIGMATTRRALRTLTNRYNDSSVQSIICFVCGQIHSSATGPEPFSANTETSLRSVADIKYQDRKWWQRLEINQPGTLLNNCSYELWQKRYVGGHYDSDGNKDGLERRCPKPPGEGLPEYDVSEWCVNLPLGGASQSVLLFGVTEDVACNAKGLGHEADNLCAPYCRKLCAECKIPVCYVCAEGLCKFDSKLGKSTIPMAVANDNYYGYALRLLHEKQVTWLECAAASLVWTTIMVYYLEEPYGHLMLESMEGPQARTQARGNLFSFSLSKPAVSKLMRIGRTPFMQQENVPFCRITKIHSPL
jgi:hypothetical protein